MTAAEWIANRWQYLVGDRSSTPPARSSGVPLAAIAALAAGTLVASRLLRRRATADLRGKVALITGASRGLGFLLTQKLAQQGCRCVICARDAAELERARQQLTTDGADVLALQCDVGDRAQVDRMITAATDHFGPIDILVNNAGVIQVGPLESMTTADFEGAMDAMFWGTVHPTLAILPSMQERRSGYVVNVTSIGGKISVPHLLPYSSAKFAAVGFSEGLRAAVAGRGVSVTTVVPGLMRTGSPLNATFKGQALKEFTWFALSDSLPFLSTDADRAADRILDGMLRGEVEVILTAPANLARWVHGLFPSQAVRTLELVNQVLPSDGRGQTAIPGHALIGEMPGIVRRVLLGWSLAAARRYNELPEQVGDGTPPRAAGDGAGRTGPTEARSG